MPIDASIPLQVHQSQPINPLADVMNIMQLRQAQQLLPLKIREAQQAAQENDLKMSKMREEADQRLGIKQAMLDANGDIETALPQILKVGGATGLAFATAHRQDQQEKLKAAGESLKNAMTSAEYGSQMLQNVLDSKHPDLAYQWSLNAMKGNGMDTSKMIQQYDPNKPEDVEALRGYIASGTPVKEQLADHARTVRDRLDALSKTIPTAEGIMGLNPDTGKWDIKVGERAPLQMAPKVEQGPDDAFHVIGPDATSKPVTENGLPLIGKPPAEGKENDFDQFYKQWLTQHKATDSASSRLAARQEWAKAGQSPERPPTPPTVMVPGPNNTMIPTLARPGVPLPANFQTAAGVSSTNVPTKATQSMAEIAPKVIDLADRISQLVDQQEKYLGPAASRWNEFMAGKVGAPNAEFTKLRTDIGLLQTALMRMHVGARGGEQIMEHFADLINSAKQSPENMRAALDEIRLYAKAVAGNVPTAQGPPADAMPGTNAAPPAGAGADKVYTQANVDAAVKAHPGLTAQQAEDAFKSKGWTKK